jgi:VanZ family protein
MERFLRPLPWAAAAWGCYWLILFISTHVPRLPRVGGPVGWDKAAHFFGYLVLALLTCTVLLRGERWSRRGAFLVLAGLMAYGVLDELLQIPIPHRTADLWDWTCDSLGAAAGIVVFRVMQCAVASRREARRKESEVALDHV